MSERTVTRLRIEFSDGTVHESEGGHAAIVWRMILRGEREADWAVRARLYHDPRHPLGPVLVGENGLTYHQTCPACGAGLYRPHSPGCPEIRK